MAMQLALTGRRSVSGYLLFAALGLAGVVLAVLLTSLTHDPLFHGPTLSAASAPAQHPQPAPEAPKSATSSVTLSAGKLKASGIRVEAARIVSLPAEVVVTGMIEANPVRRVDIRPRVPGIVRAVNVSPSQHVKAGDLLATLDSVDVGTARLNLRARQLDLSIARTEAEWKSEVAANVAVLIPALRKSTPAAVLEKQFADKPLGSHRAELLAAYADLEIAAHEETKQTELYRKEIVGEHYAFVALHARESAQAKFEAALEQVRFDAAQQKRIADQQVRRAEAGVIDAFKRLQILGVNDGSADPLAKLGEISIQAAAAEDVTFYPLVAPFDGTIITMSAVYSQRAEPTDVLFTLANLSTVHMVGNIPESEFAVLPSLKNATVRVTAAAYPGRTFSAKVLYTTEMVDPTTRRVRLVAETDNPDGLLRLGMFVQIRLDSPTTERVLTVPAAAIVEIDGRRAVFIPDSSGRTFTLRHVTTGREVGGRRVINAGVSPGERLVAEGSFVLKSELLLQNQPEED